MLEIPPYLKEYSSSSGRTTYPHNTGENEIHSHAKIEQFSTSETWPTGSESKLGSPSLKSF